MVGVPDVHEEVFVVLQETTETFPLQTLWSTWDTTISSCIRSGGLEILEFRLEQPQVCAFEKMMILRKVITAQG